MLPIVEETRNPPDPPCTFLPRYRQTTFDWQVVVCVIPHIACHAEFQKYNKKKVEM